MATAVWAFVHGMAFLHLDGKFDTATPDAAPDRVRAAVHALLTASETASPMTARPSRRRRA
jgi:hypothetical protein